LADLINLEHFRLHIFDLDDTLIQTRKSYYTAQEFAVDELFDKLGLSDKQAAYEELHWFSKVIGSINPLVYMGAFLKNRGFESNENLAFMVRSYREAYWSVLKLYPGALEFLTTLEEGGFELALVSNGKSSTQLKKLREIGLENFFAPQSRLISGDFEPIHQKPSPYLIELAMSIHGALPEETIYYGNTMEDVIAANLAGATSLLFGPLEIDPKTPKVAHPHHKYAQWPILQGPLKLQH